MTSTTTETSTSRRSRGTFHTAYTATSWLCWVPNLLIALWITRSRPDPPNNSKGI